MRIILLLLISVSSFAQKDTVNLTTETKFISVNDLYKAADVYKDSVMARQYENFLVIFNAVINRVIGEEQKKKHDNTRNQGKGQ